MAEMGSEDGNQMNQMTSGRGYILFVSRLPLLLGLSYSRVMILTELTDSQEATEPGLTWVIRAKGPAEVPDGRANCVIAMLGP